MSAKYKIILDEVRSDQAGITEYRFVASHTQMHNPRKFIIELSALSSNFLGQSTVSQKNVLCPE